jgi:hypothetical protein
MMLLLRSPNVVRVQSARKGRHVSWGKEKRGGEGGETRERKGDKWLKNNLEIAEGRTNQETNHLVYLT